MDKLFELLKFFLISFRACCCNLIISQVFSYIIYIFAMLQLLEYQDCLKWISFAIPSASFSLRSNWMKILLAFPDLFPPLVKDSSACCHDSFPSFFFPSISGLDKIFQMRDIVGDIGGGHRLSIILPPSEFWFSSVYGQKPTTALSEPPCLTYIHIYLPMQ